MAVLLLSMYLHSTGNHGGIAGGELLTRRGFWGNDAGDILAGRQEALYKHE